MNTTIAKADVDLVVFCFAKPQDAEAFCDRLVGNEYRAVPGDD
jgi:hypothetical protein